LSAGAPYAVLSVTPGNAKPIFRTVSKLIVLLRMGEYDYPQEQEPFQDGQRPNRMALINQRSKRGIAR
jgi:hypothetical protein